VVGKIDFEFTDSGIQTFKNINKPVQTYSLTSAVLSGNTATPDQAPKPRTHTPSIAVLALSNLNHDPDLDYIGDGITEDVITALSKIRAFKVISRESTFSYKNTAVDIRQIAKELNVLYVLEGSVRKAGSRVRVTAQLIDAETGHHVWAERYDREMEDIFDLQDEMTQVIASALEPELNAAECERALLKSPDNLDAWEMYQRALWHMWTFEAAHENTAMKLFKQSIQMDPNFAPAYAYLCYSCYITVIMGYAEDPDARLNEALGYAETALKCDDKDAISYFAIGRIQMMQGDHDASIASLRKSIALNPCFAQAYHGLGFALSLSGELEESKLMTEKAIELSPRDPMLWAFTAVHAMTCLLDNDNEEALNVANQTKQIPTSTGYWSHALLAAALANLDRMAEARKALAEALKQKPDLSISFLKHNMPTKHKDGLEPYLSGLRKSGLKDL
jgi:adenylate cyclase